MTMRSATNGDEQSVAGTRCEQGGAAERDRRRRRVAARCLLEQDHAPEGWRRRGDFHRGWRTVAPAARGRR